MNDSAASPRTGKDDPGAQYAKIVQWSEEDQCYFARAPDLIYGGCHGDDPRRIFEELCQIVDEVIAMYEADGDALPDPTNALDMWRERHAMVLPQ